MSAASSWPTRSRLIVISVVGVGAGAAAGAALALIPHGLGAGVVVGATLAVRLGAANLDGGVARARGVTSRAGSVANEVGDRLAELAALAGALALAPTALVLLAALAMSAPSWVALAGSAAGAPRLNGGPVGKTERAAGLALIALTGWAWPLLLVLAVGSAATAGLRLTRILTSSLAAAR